MSDDESVAMLQCAESSGSSREDTTSEEHGGIVAGSANTRGDDEKEKGDTPPLWSKPSLKADGWR